MKILTVFQLIKIFSIFHGTTSFNIMNPVLSHFNPVYIVIDSLRSIVILPCSVNQSGGLFPAGCLDTFFVCILPVFCKSSVSFCFIQSSQ